MEEIKTKFFYRLNEDIRNIRKKVFCDEQGFSIENEFDKRDNESTHIVLYYSNKAVGTARFFKNDENDSLYHIGRVAVLKEYRKFGFGKKIIQEIEKKILSLKGSKIVLSAQTIIKDFYKSLGYIETGEEYHDEHCMHIDMIKDLRENLGKSNENFR